MKICTRYYTGTHGLYVKAIPDYKTVERLKLLVSQSDPPCSIEHQFHATVVSSDVTPRSIYITYPGSDIFTRLLKAEYWTGFNGRGFVVLRLRAKPFNSFHRMYLYLGAEHKYPGGYIPHVTAGMSVGGKTEEISRWLVRLNSSIHLFDPPVVFNRMRVRDVRF